MADEAKKTKKKKTTAKKAEGENGKSRPARGGLAQRKARRASARRM